MNKIPLEKLDIDVYHETLESGLDIFVVKKENSNNTKASLFTKYGAEIEEFVPRGETKMRKFPLGIAHFLEHQMFNMEDGSVPFDVFSNNGASCNAYTNYKITNYYFSGVNNVLDNIEYLLKYVGMPYFTKESVQKEKGIIVEEAKMYENDVYTKIYDKINANTYKESPRKFNVIGMVKDIKKTTEQDLMDCYNTFYHPSNMVLLVVGNVEAVDVIEIARKSKLNQNHKNDTYQKIKIKKIKEPKEVVREKEIVKLAVEIPKVYISYKIYIDNYSDLEKEKIGRYINFILDSKFGRTSLFSEQIKEDQVVKTGIDLSHGQEGDYYVITIGAETALYDEFIKRVLKEMSDFMITNEEFERKKKKLLSSYIDISDDIFDLYGFTLFEIQKFGTISDNAYTKVKNYSYAEMKEMIKKINLRNRTILIVEKED